jgi:DNA-binding CsgD family transcriptional regulator
VHHFDLAQYFIESCERLDPMEEVTAFFQTCLHRLGFGYFACCSHVDPTNLPSSAVMVHNYPSVWVAVFTEMKFHEIDPVLSRAERSPFPFFWDDPMFRSKLTKEQCEILAAAGTLGIENGYTVPLHLPWVPGALRGSCSLVPDGDAVDARRYAIAQQLATHFYAAMIRAHLPSKDPAPIILSRWERDCLELVAQGESDWVIGEALGINEGIVHQRVENVLRRLGVATRAQAITQAVMARQISFGGVVRREP